MSPRVRRPVRGPAGRTSLTALAALTLGLTVTACGPPEEPDVRVAAASDLVHAWAELAPLVEDRLPEGSRVEVTFGSSGVLARQIENGAPYDVYLSADVDLPQRLVDGGHADEQDLFRYAVGLLAVWTPEGSALDGEHPGADDPDPAAAVRLVAHPAAGQVATAHPGHAPYGRLAADALEAAGLTEEVAPRLVRGENVAQALELVRSGDADVGLVALSLLVEGPLAGEGRWTAVPVGLTSPLVQGGVVLGGARDRTAAAAVPGALLSPEGQAVLARFGFERVREGMEG